MPNKENNFVNLPLEKIVFSIVVPILNEEKILDQLSQRLNQVIAGLRITNYEIIFVDDGSTDQTLQILRKFNQKDQRYKTISFSRNFGHQTAISAGLKYAQGQTVVVMDGDLQDPPELIPQMLAKWQQGYQVVYAVRKKRKENFIKKIIYKLYYRLLKRIAKIHIPLDAGDFCLMDQKVVLLLNNLPERNRFVRGLRSWIGFKQIGIAYERDKRYAGKPKYTINKLITLAFDGLISFSEAPLKSAIFIGFLISVLSFFYALGVGVLRLINFKNSIPGWTTIVAAITFLGGVQLMMTGLIGEYIARIFDEVKKRPMYIINEAIGFNQNGDKFKKD